jgi:hypothetical protein
MTIRSLTSSLSLMTVLSLGLVACGDDGKPMLTTATTAPNTTNPNTTNNNTTEGDTETAGTDTETAGTDGVTEGTTVAPTTTEPATTTTTTTSPATTDDTTGEPAEGAYGPCGAMGECPVGSECVSLMGIEGNFCSPKCDGMACPDTGTTAQGQCVLVLEGSMDPTNCAAICELANPDCPTGTSCKDVMMMGIGLCTAP